MTITITIYLLDGQQCFAGAREVNPMGALPASCVLAAPPATTGTQVAQWADGAWTVLPSYPQPPMDGVRAAAVLRIDAEVDAIYGAVIGSRQAEYDEAERQGHAYADAGYTGAVPGMVASWATAKGWTAKQAADDIVAQALAWRGAQDQIRGARLLKKEQARTAADPAALALVMTQWAGFAAAARAQLGIA